MLTMPQIGAGQVKIENIPFPCMLIGLKGELLDYNKKAEELFETNFEEERIYDVRPFFSKNGKETFSLFIEMVQIKGMLQDFQMNLKKKKCLSKAVAISGTPIMDNAGNCYAINCFIRDISKEDMFLDQIKTELLIFRNFFENVPMGAAIKIAGHIMIVNEMLEKMMGYTHTYLCETYLPRFFKRNQDRFENRAVEEMFLFTGHSKRLIVDVRKFKVDSLLPNSDMEVFLFYDKKESAPSMLEFFTPSLHNCS